MKCKNCQAELPDQSTSCTYCGETLIEMRNENSPLEAEQPTAIEAEIVAQEQATESAHPTVVENNATLDKPTHQGIYTGQFSYPNPTMMTANPPKKKWKIVLPIVGAVILIAAIAVLIYMSGADGRTVEEASKLAQDKKYFEALNLLDTIKNPTYDTEREIDAVKEDIFDDIEEEIEEMLDDGDNTAALKMLEKFPELPSYNDMEELVYTALEEDVQSFMNEGDYVAAQEFLNEHIFLTNYDKLCRQVKYETFIVQCAFDLRPLMKNPRSLMITDVEIYESESEYPTIIFDISGQNGFGGYTTSYVVFDNDDLTYLGMCSSIYDPDDDEYLTAYLIRMYRSDPEITNAVFDLERVNRFLADGDMPTIDFVQYINSEGSNV